MQSKATKHLSKEILFITIVKISRLILTLFYGLTDSVGCRVKQPRFLITHIKHNIFKLNFTAPHIRLASNDT